MFKRVWKGSMRLLSVAGLTVLLGLDFSGQQPKTGPGVAAAQQGANNSLEGFIAQATKAVNSRQVAGLRPLLLEGATGTFAWVESAHETWEGAALQIPQPFKPSGADAPPGILAVFHAWHSSQSDGDHVHRLVPTSQGWRLGPEIPETETLGFRVRDHDLHVSFDVPLKTAMLLDTIQVERTANRVPEFAFLRISHDFLVQSISVGKTAVPFHQAGGIIAFTPPEARRFALTLHYSGHLDNKESDYIRPNEAVLCSYWYPHIARLPATTTVTVTTPPEWTGIAQGERTKETHSLDGTTAVTYRNDMPNCFYTLDIGRYTLTTRRINNRTLSVYQLAPNPALARLCLDTLEAAMDFYERSFAPFPFTRYAIVETQGAFVGALEAYSFATFGPHTLPELIPHELAHTWWGGATPCTYTHSMWDEAFAEYSDDLFTRSRQESAPKSHSDYPLPAKLLEERRTKAASYAAIPLSQAFDTENDHHIAVGYDKGRQVLKMLETQLGQATMLRSMRRFFAQHPRGKAADWPEFEGAVQNETGTDYHWFFREWLERKGLPTLALAHTTLHKDDTGYVVETDVQQEGQPYRLQLPVLLEIAGGAPVQTTKEIDGVTTHLTFRLASPPLSLRLDPRGEVLFAPPLGTAVGFNPTIFAFTP